MILQFVKGKDIETKLAPKLAKFFRGQGFKAVNREKSVDVIVSGDDLAFIDGMSMDFYEEFVINGKDVELN